MTGAAETTNDSTVGMSLAGDFDNRSIYPSLFNWANGKLTINGTEAQTFEVAGLDLGLVAEGFSRDQGTLFEPDPLEPHQKYATGTVNTEGAPENPPQHVRSGVESPDCHRSIPLAGAAQRALSFA